MFLVGTHRSGTTWLGGLLGQAKGFAYWPEPRQVWTYGNWRNPDDVLRARHATERIKRHIRKRFLDFTMRRGGNRFCEKTPSNCLRIPFIHEVFPEGKVILLIRDGRAVYRSTDEIQSKGADWNRMRDRIRESSFKELPAYFDRIPWIFRKLTGQRLDFWGVRPPGWKEWLGKYSPAQVIALQWANSISIAYEQFGEMPESSGIIVRYEELISNPAEQFARLCEFALIADAEEFIARGVKSARPENQNKWRAELPEDLLEEIKPILLPTLTQLDYKW